MFAPEAQTRRSSADTFGYGCAGAKKAEVTRKFGTNLTNRTVAPAAAMKKPTAIAPRDVPCVTLGAAAQTVTATATAIQHEVERPMAAHSTRLVMDDIEIPDLEVDSSRDRKDPAQVTTYIHDIMKYFKGAEKKYMADPRYLEPGSINAKVLSKTMRATVINWIVNVHRKFKLKQETLFLAINIVDRFLASTPVSKDKLTLVAATSLLVASKFEDQWAPLIRDLVYVGSNSFTATEIRNMERTMLNALQFEISCPTVFPFLARGTKAAQLDGNHTKLASYVAEVALHSYEILNFPPSMVAAASVALTLRMAKRGAWTTACTTATGYAEVDMVPCMQQINSVLKALPAEVKAVRNKYTGSAMGNVSAVRPVDL